MGWGNDWDQQVLQRNSEIDGRKAGSGNWTLSDWESYSKVGTMDRTKVAPRTFYYPGSEPWNEKNFSAWRGGLLNKQDMSAVKYLQAEEYQDEYEASYEEAKEANESRYTSILEGFDEMYDTQKDMLDGMGDAEKEELQRIAGRMHASNAATTVKSGMQGTTVLAAMDRQTSKDHASNLGLMNDRINQQKLGAYSNYQSGKLGVMERRTDEYPDFNMYLSLMQGLGGS